MELSVKYVFIYVSKLEEGSVFYRDVLGFEQAYPIIDLMQNHVAFCNVAIGMGIILIESEQVVKGMNLVLNTTDCIKDYLQLKANGVVFAKVPDYNDKGLEAEFIDPYGNVFTLLEERIYEKKIL
ncbi:hypothetical protein WAE58_20820 [Pedobacter panaciterrae]|uniref:VOC domain-containing protein n=1 Tax=Pedobacter panaciterrae TaxID=363849 RepID=A0ABU8NRM4_9SPHI|nr:hypothetical protein [uncultured Pedobacter sp.]